MKPVLVAGLMLAVAVGLSFLPSRMHATPVKAKSDHPLRVGLVLDVGGRGDKSFNDSAYLGIERAEKELGIEASTLEPAGSEDREAALRLFAARKLDLVIGVGFIFSSDIEAVAKSYPDVRFACVDYSPTSAVIPPNVRGLAFREEEGSFLVGVVAGSMSKSKKVGFVGGMTIPLIRKFQAGYTDGVTAACPECTVTSTYAGSTPDAFKDPERGKTIALSQIAGGADILFHASGATGHGVFEAAHDAHVFAIGVDNDQYDEMPDAIVTSLVKRVDVAVYQTIKDIQDGHFSGGMRAYGLQDQGVDYVHEGPHAARIPADVRARVDQFKQEIIDGKRHVRSE